MEVYIILEKSLFSSPKLPAQKPPTTMPDESDPSVMAAGRRRARRARGGSGRSSTIMGGDQTYSDDKMGGM